MLILAKKYGRLCNRLFNAVHILAFAIEHKHTFVNPAFYDYAEHFEATAHDPWCRYPEKPQGAQPSRFRRLVQYRLVNYAANLCLQLSRFTGLERICGITSLRPGNKRTNPQIDLSALKLDLSDPRRIVMLQGWNLRAFDLVIKHGAEIREYFRPARHYQEEVDVFLAEKRREHDLLVGVVIRHGDYRRWQEGRYFYSRETYCDLMQQMCALNPGKKVWFLICSDEEQDTAVFKEAGLSFFFRSGHMMQNLYSLAGCDYLITPPSTFGMWPSFYGRTPMYIIEDPELPLSLSESFEVCQG
ncbi:hypothetical protein GMST_39340 [Geomonas silvestris]|uniref:Alpha-1,2-fucosyltransferase n=1 Tax=Geomonas silvestris TaxID=2740184 RepID=A0A6V8MPR5_9BACT|nr:hypothetical protein [Geomonas silvestris]GFO61609.1 hypothetical protein GMST_39340 [Geomonas silvestris]